MLLKKTKKIMSIVLSMLFMVSILPAIPAFAAYEGSCVEGVTYLFDQSTGTLTISGNGKMIDYPCGSKTPWGSYGISIRSVTIEDGVTSIGDNAFNGCSGLEAITIPSSVTSIGYMEFSGCNGLTSITIPSSVTSVGDWAFYGCSGLTSVTIENGETEIGCYAFSGCINLTSLNYLGNTVPKCGHGGNIFSGCSNLSSVKVPVDYQSYDFCGIPVVRDSHCDVQKVTDLENGSAKKESMRYNEKIKCKRCKKEDKQVKVGKTRAGSQVYKCKHCGKKYTPKPKKMRYSAERKRYSEEIKRQAIKLYMEGNSGSAVERRLRLGQNTCLYWVKKYAKEIKPKNKANERVEVIEMDERFV